jgi:hypothetical protein
MEMIYDTKMAYELFKFSWFDGPEHSGQPRIWQVDSNGGI